ncbi:hypothetical protein [Sphingomonas sp. IW22]|uniref:hypothetical protein n=1 Tax=Sphingomonas sp. IW22 TaxID=3242489 RepID=UPI003520C741
MEVTKVSGGSGQEVAHPLKSWMLSPRKIGNRRYQGHCVIAEAMHVTYQQQSTTFGRTAGVFGLSKDGDGFVTGGGGFVDTVHKGVVTVVFRDEDGAEQTHELPAAVATRNGTVARLDMMGSNVIGATNLSGKGRFLQLMDASSFIAMPKLLKREILLAVVALFMITGALPRGDTQILFWGLVAALFPAIKIWRIVKARSERRELNGYMGEVFA